MNSFNLKKKAKKEEITINEKQIEKQRKSMDLSNEKQDVIGKNINLSIPIKDKDNTVPFNVQLEAARKGKDDNQIIEAKMDKKQTSINDKRDNVMPINRESQKYDDKRAKAYDSAKSKKDTSFWDKYVGVQMEKSEIKVDKNISDKATQLSNKKIEASVRDADAMLFHIYATAVKENRDLTPVEKQQIIDINSGKHRILSQNIKSVKSKIEISQDPKIVQDEDGTFSVVEEDGKSCAKGYKSCRDARIDFPEASE